MHISVIGVGYVGLVTGACFAETGNDVVCMDIDKEKIKKLKKGIIPIYEPQLEELVKNNLKEGRLRFSTDIKEAVDHGLIIFICVNTPQDEDGSADLKYVHSVAQNIGRYIEKYRIVVVKSTVPVGTCEMVKETIAKELEERKVDVPFDIASNPEFLKEGMAVDDCMKPERVVIGVEHGRVEEILRELYNPYVRTGAPFLVMDIRSSEMTKYTANAMLATRISFMNQIANICEKVGADVMMVMRGIGSDSRIGPKFLFPGVGFGGSCFPKDVRALIKTSQNYGYTPTILEDVMKVNEEQRVVFTEKILNFYNNNIKGKRFAIWGLAFKPNTDDMREAPAIYIVDTLARGGGICNLFDPKAMEVARGIFKGNKNINFGANQYEVLKDADCLVLITEWLSFREPDFEKMKALMRSPVIFDGRNQYNPKKMAELGFRYTCIGRKNV
ncbi:MAG TPA: UDP-glucose/GDP-mannose dehydrogenase family protein [Syntrophorhabdaceae bacterium]|nr:UDP-glucose/GDP-mannose dehydrogenase family protein [Syntrophorhabdaceae bacterium]HOT41299.1 UDP-glucose/GDP-mannose dehydrogenase family protein [Syntrophorhabdaceae bacterium]HPC66737.1 UDP-glucose/GDP-mannose dehydrogenase family protein [Syntrophorhabdaceae bacterium]HQH42631.1 UDP-glucose/GDP-mannose dehydrogenase family protein [Syntrophorhabdaceae bacterium]HRR71301.1 UDP-glucose/GDP-mannose dehydrogenase family protein [Syntrophorhabdaceae bacterium]